jgi:hypothetical protein
VTTVLGQQCFHYLVARDINGVAPGTYFMQLFDVAGGRPKEYMDTLPYPFVPIVSAGIYSSGTPGEYTVSIDRGQTNLNLAQPPIYELAPIANPWYLNHPLAGLLGSADRHYNGPIIPPIIYDRRYDALWADALNTGTVPAAVAWHICWDGDLAAQLNEGFVPSGWLTSAGTVIATGANGGWDNYTVAVLIAPGVQSNRCIELINGGGSQVRVTFAAGPSNTPIVKAYIGRPDTGMTQLTFGGNVGATIPANLQTVSDGVPFTLDATKPLLVKVLFGAGASVRLLSGGLPGWSSYYKLADDAVSNSIAGYTQATAQVVSIVRVETLH